LEINSSNGETLIAVVSDGAGSAPLSDVGARIVTRSFCRSLIAFARSGGLVADIDEEIAGVWLDDVRDRVDQIARTQLEPRRSFAATLVVCVAQRQGSIVLHVGDGGCALRVNGESNWQVPSWPSHGEYASTTYFVTDDPEPRTKLVHVEGEVAEIALFTDGLERIVLDFNASTAFAPFFESMFPWLRSSPGGRQRSLSFRLRDFLDSPAINARTDDDKTLIMARRT
jgi:hypothetical protein